MTANARAALAVFEALTPTEQQQVAAEIMRRSGEGDLPEAVLDELVMELFRSYDAEETLANGCS